jgi:hypothetical protein
MLKEWRGVVIQLANLAAIVYLATHATETMAHFALGAVAATNAMAHARARLDSAYGGRWGGGPAARSLASLAVRDRACRPRPVLSHVHRRQRARSSESPAPPRSR